MPTSLRVRRGCLPADDATMRPSIFCVRKTCVIPGEKAERSRLDLLERGRQIVERANKSRGDSKMKKFMIAALVAFALAPVAAFATPTPAQQASQDCASLRAKMGVTPFVQAFATPGTSNAFGKCVSKLASVERANVTSATTLCQAEQADANFAATHGGKTFVQFYGTKSGKNAFSRCVSLKMKSSSTKEQAELNPAKACSALKTTMTAPLFAQSFGTNQGHRN